MLQSSLLFHVIMKIIIASSCLDLTYVQRLFTFSMKISWQDKDP